MSRNYNKSYSNYSNYSNRDSYRNNEPQTNNNYEPSSNTDEIFVDTNPYPEVDDFDNLGVDEKILRGIYSMGYEIPSVIQRKAITPMIKGHDLIAQAQSGSGKTACFLIGSMQKVDISLNKPQVVVVCHNRELAQQIYYNFECLNQYTKIKGALIMGGTVVEDNFRALDNGAQFIVGTPGRIYDMMKRYVLKTDNVKCFIMDEADEMLSKGFKEQIYEIFQFIPKKCQVCIFSATMTEEALELTKKFIPNAVKILVKPEKVTVEGIKQYYLGIESETWKLETLFDLYERLQISQTIIFVNSINKAEFIRDKLEEENFVVDCIHSGMSQMERDKIMTSFRTGESRVLVATDVIARGIDVQQVSIVINYDMPKYCETYVHRIGRSGRYGRKGIAINFVTDDDKLQLDRIKRYYRTEINPLPENIKDMI
jgi:translation initiation factor 4A